MQTVDVVTNNTPCISGSLVQMTKQACSLEHATGGALRKWVDNIYECKPFERFLKISPALEKGWGWGGIGVEVEPPDHHTVTYTYKSTSAIWEVEQSTRWFDDNRSHALNRHNY